MGDTGVARTRARARAVARVFSMRAFPDTSPTPDTHCGLGCGEQVKNRQAPIFTPVLTYD